MTVVAMNLGDLSRFDTLKRGEVRADDAAVVLGLIAVTYSGFSDGCELMALRVRLHRSVGSRATAAMAMPSVTGFWRSCARTTPTLDRHLRASNSPSDIASRFRAKRYAR